ncbi:chromosome segregation SMC family protein [Curtobacterium sp. 24E2]
MYLKSLTIKGFKSFAQPTTFAFEPGVTCIVGPNGSGKSNVVDALAWVMGEQGAKTLRGGKMEDVIFAGTSTRGPLGRAQVLLTIDNTDGLLPIDYSEVTIARTLFRNGGSEYAINGENCRLLDVQELLSDTGLGREMHVIVGQGQLDKVLHATPEDRRGFIEEAAGILKHRRRKEKTLRKLDAMQTNLTRLSDLAGEIRRQLKPLGRQAEVARKAQSVAAVARDAKARILADDVVRLRRELHDHQEVEAGRKSERIVLTERLDQTRVRQQHVEQSMVGDDVDRARTVVHRLESVQERLRGLSSLANQRLMFLAQQADAPQQGPQSPRSGWRVCVPRPIVSPPAPTRCRADPPRPPVRCRPPVTRSTPSTNASPRRPPGSRSTTSRRNGSRTPSTWPGRSAGPRSRTVNVASAPSPRRASAPSVRRRPSPNSAPIRPRASTTMPSPPRSRRLVRSWRLLRPPATSSATGCTPSSASEMPSTRGSRRSACRSTSATVRRRSSTPDTRASSGAWPRRSR